MTDFHPGNPDTWPMTLTDVQIAAIYQQHVTTIRKKCQKGLFVPAPIADSHPRRWRKVDVLRHCEGARGSMRRAS